MIKKIDYDYVDNKNTTIVFMHGWGLDKSVFDRLVHFFSFKYSILNISFLGFGKSDTPLDYYDTYEYAYSVFLLLKELGVNRVVFVGHSFGGRVAIILSSIFDIDVRGMVLTSSAGLNRFSIIKKFKIIKYKIVKFLVKKKFMPNKVITKYGSDDYKKLTPNMKGVFVKVVNQDLLFLLKKINCNTCLVWDKRDRVTPYWICKKLHKNIMNSKIILFENGGHFACFCNINKFVNIIGIVCVVDNDS